MKKVICKRCGEFKKYHAKGYCKPCYDNYLYHTNEKYRKCQLKCNKKWIKEHPEYMKKWRGRTGYNKKQILRNRNKNLIQRFGFIPKIYLHNKGITSDGCFVGNSKCIMHYKQPSYLVNRKNIKMMWLYREKAFYKYKIQIVNAVTQEEFWIRFKGKMDDVIKVFNRLKRYPINHIKYWEMETGFKQSSDL